MQCRHCQCQLAVSATRTKRARQESNRVPCTHFTPHIHTISPFGCHLGASSIIPKLAAQLHECFHPDQALSDAACSLPSHTPRLCSITHMMHHAIVSMQLPHTPHNQLSKVSAAFHDHGDADECEGVAAASLDDELMMSVTTSAHHASLRYRAVDFYHI